MLAKFTKHARARRIDGASAGAGDSSINRACNDNRPAGARATVSLRPRRPMLSCHWRVVAATGALECFWQDESADGAPAPSPSQSRMRHVRQPDGARVGLLLRSSQVTRSLIRKNCAARIVHRAVPVMLA